MNIYRGDYNANFEIKPWIRSRYGFQALFFTTEVALARLYAIHAAKQRQMPGAGAVYEAEVNDLWVYTYDFGGKCSYGPDFRNMIHTFRDFNHKAAHITNVLDYPDKSMVRIETSDIVVIYDLAIINNLTRVDQKIWMP